MSTAQVNALSSGFVAFVVIWALVLVPQLMLQWHRFGRIVPRRIATTAGVLAYACLALAVVFLPLPGPRMQSTGVSLQLRPFQWVTDLRHDMAGTGLLHALTTPDFEQMAMNVVLFVPLGIFARLLWKRGLVGTTLLGFGISLLVEVTQLTANWGTAPFQYRIADVDDVITNTTGALLGWIAGALYLTLRRAAVARSSAVGPEPVRRERVDLTQPR